MAKTFSLKKGFPVYLIALLFLIFTSLPSYSVNTDNSKLTTLKPGKLLVATYFTNPPFEFLNNNKQIGFEVDLIKEIAKRLNLSLEFKNTQWEKIINELRANDYDLIMGAITITADREKLVAFSKPYMTTTLSIVINTNKTPEVKTLADLSSLSMGVQAATTDLDIALQMKKQGSLREIKIYPFKGFNLAINDLVKGKIGAVMKVFPVAYYYVQQHPELKILSAVPNDPQPLGFGINKNNPSLVNAINKTQAAMQKDGTYTTIYDKWFGTQGLGGNK